MLSLSRLAVTTTVATLAAAGIHVYTQGTISTLADCTVSAVQAKATAGTTITAARIVEPSDGVPRHCQVDGHVATPGNEVNFRLGLPERWNGKYYFVGVGGLGGTIGSLSKGLQRGFGIRQSDPPQTGA